MSFCSYLSERAHTTAAAGFHQEKSRRSFHASRNQACSDCRGRGEERRITFGVASGPGGPGRRLRNIQDIGVRFRAGFRKRTIGRMLVNPPKSGHHVPYRVVTEGVIIKIVVFQSLKNSYQGHLTAHEVFRRRVLNLFVDRGHPKKKSPKNLRRRLYRTRPHGRAG